jgi:hypothetical protein
MVEHIDAEVQVSRRHDYFKVFLKAYDAHLESLTPAAPLTPILPEKTLRQKFLNKFSKKETPRLKSPPLETVNEGEKYELAAAYSMTVYKIETMITRFGENWSINSSSLKEKFYLILLHKLFSGNNTYWLYAKGTNDPLWREHLIDLIIDIHNPKLEHTDYSLLLYAYNNFDKETFNDLKNMPFSVMYDTLKPLMDEVENEFKKFAEQKEAERINRKVAIRRKQLIESDFETKEDFVPIYFS